MQPASKETTDVTRARTTGPGLDRIARLLAARRDRRGVAVAVAGAALLGLGAAARAETVSPDGNSGQGRPCSRNSKCGSGLRCVTDPASGKGQCAYKNDKCGKKNSYCKSNRDCCGGLRCGNSNKCVRL